MKLTNKIKNKVQQAKMSIRATTTLQKTNDKYCNLNFTVGTITDGRWDTISKLIESFNKNTVSKNRCKILLTDNCNYDKKDLTPILNSFENDNKELIINLERKSISYNWHQIIENAKTDWIVILNDDSMFMPNWDYELEEYISKIDKGFFALCIPNSFSGFAIKKEFYNKYGPFRQEYPGGGYEDEDFCLEILRKSGLRTSKDLTSKKIFVFANEENRGLITHYKNSKFKKGNWSNYNLNEPIFKKYWEETKSPNENSYQGKSNKWYNYLGK